MSIRIMSAVWQLSEYRNGKRLVLLALADWANDDGVCWPKMPTIAEKAGITERGASGIMRQLVSDGVIEILDAGGGRGHSRRYRIRLPKKGEAGSSFTPTKDEGGSRKRMKVEARKDERGDITIRKNHHEPPEKQPPPALRIFVLPEWVPVGPWNAFLDMRKKSRASPTPYAVEKLVLKLGKLRDEGYDLTEILDNSTMNSWKGFVKPNQNGDRNGKSIPARTQQNSAALRGFHDYEARKNREPSHGNC